MLVPIWNASQNLQKIVPGAVYSDMAGGWAGFDDIGSPHQQLEGRPIK